MTPQASAKMPTRRAGLLIPLFSLRSGRDWGIGEISDLAEMAEWAAGAGFRTLMLLPFHELWRGETSPYSAVTAFALDPVYISMDAVADFAAAGGLAALDDETRALVEDLHAQPGPVRWHEARRAKLAALAIAHRHFQQNASAERRNSLAQFAARESAWLEDFALYWALAEQHGPGWMGWPAPLRARTPEALAEARAACADRVAFRTYVEWLLHEQWAQAQAHAQSRGVTLGGDLPFVVSRDAADVWAHQDMFHLDLRLGCPPDAFSADGQDWGLPVFDWEALRGARFDWMRRRAQRSAALASLWRVDHVVGLFRSYYRTSDGRPPGFTPPDEPDQIALGKETLRVLFAAGELVAEDLGTVPDFVRTSLTELGVPGFRVLRWEKDDQVFRDPATWPALSVATTGTHDTDTLREWWAALEPGERQAFTALPALAALRDAGGDWTPQVQAEILRLVYAAPSALLLLPFQDALGLTGRVNLPGSVSETNWVYRMPMTIGALRGPEFSGATERLAALATESGRV